MARSRPPVLAQLKYRENEPELRKLGLAQKFGFIHRTNMWGASGSTSGVGSTLEATGAIRGGLADVCRLLKIRSLLDAPCGDASWITAADLPIDTYLGVDIVPELIQRNRELYSPDRFQFSVADLTCDPLPASDLILCRDCLVHLSFINITRVLRNFCHSGSKYLLTTTFPDHDTNEDIADGDWRMLNLERRPFSLPRPELTINEECDEIGGAYRDKSLGLWPLAAFGSEWNR